MAIFIIHLLHNLIQTQYKHHEALYRRPYIEYVHFLDRKTVDKCRDCETSVSAKSDILRNHNIKCGAVTKNTSHKSSFDTNYIDENSTTPTDKPATKKMKVQRAANGFCTTTDAKTKAQLDDLQHSIQHHM